MKARQKLLFLCVVFFTGAVRADDDDPFTVVKVVPGYNYFIAETPAWYAVVEDYLCPMPSEGDTGKGNLITYFSTPVTLNGYSCTAWVETWGGSSTVQSRLAEKCGSH